MGIFAQSAAAQNSTSAFVNATAFVNGVSPLTAAGVHDLVFGTVAAGASATPTATNVGRFLVSGQPSAPVFVSFQLPTKLQGAGTATIPITFSNTDGLEFSNFPGTFTTFNPNTQYSTTLSGTGSLDLGISGMVTPPLGTTTTGNYTGTITLTVSY